jgi:hypothetical protein
VVLVASDPGIGLSGYTPPVGALTMIDNLEYVASVQAYGAVGGGIEEESDDSYISRLSAELQLLTPRPRARRPGSSTHVPPRWSASTSLGPRDWVLSWLLAPGCPRATPLCLYFGDICRSPASNEYALELWRRGQPFDLVVDAAAACRGPLAQLC